MPNDRLIKLLSLKQSLPNDPFVDYAMALEYVKLDDVEKASALFLDLYNQHPDYLPIYYHYGVLLINTDQLKRAEKIIQEGTQLAKQQNDTRTVSELNGLLEILDDL